MQWNMQSQMSCVWMNEQYNLFLQCTSSLFRHDKIKSTTATHLYVEKSSPQTIPLHPNRAKIHRAMINKQIINCYRHLKLKNLFENWTQCTPLRLPPIAGWPPDGERLVIAGFIVARRDIGRKFGHLRRKSVEQFLGGDRQVTTGWVYSFV